MAPGAPASIHASCVAIGETGVLIRGPSGAGKSRLALRLILDPPRILPPAELVADDRVILTVEAGALVARPAPGLEGLIEVRGLGIRRMPHRPAVALRHVVDLMAADAERMPSAEARRVMMEGVEISRLPLNDPETAALIIACILTSDDYEN
ncbi:HPr kinase/phosphatase C-terminal domain-containing protein [Xanthobacter sp. KR7-65]|uniref:HPr kinase/phosphorylase n=1 Tax=Xanthobacter sp. KR7-65 TaxID=3156612 RepID=UPI0032B432C6